MGETISKVAILFSGGTDSTASASLLSEQFKEIHLLTYSRYGIHKAENSKFNYKKLVERFPNTKYIHNIFETSELAKYIANYKRWHYIRKYGFFTLQNCGFCAVVNHVATITHCLQNNIKHSADGITHDWPFFPPHMDKVIDKFRELYKYFGITYHTPVLHFDVEEPPRYIDKIFTLKESGKNSSKELNTTGLLLYKLGLADTINYKGTDLDRKVQVNCFQFTIPNLFIYWVFRGQERWGEYEAIILEYFSAVIQDCKELIEKRFEYKNQRLFSFLNKPMFP